MPQLAAEGFLEIGLGEDIGGQSGGQDLAIDHHGPVAVFRYRAEIVRGDEHHAPFLAEILQKLDDLVMTGPTLTNVMDIYMLLVGSSR